MSNYIDLVICTFDDGSVSYVCKAPAWSHLKKGDNVIVEYAENTTTEMIVEKTYTANIPSAELEFILLASSAELPLRRILKKVEYKEFKYEDAENEKSGSVGQT